MTAQTLAGAHAASPDLERQTYAKVFWRLVPFLMLCYVVALALIWVVGLQYGLGLWFAAGMLVACGFAVYHYTLIRERDRMRCFAAFNNNNWLGAAIFAGVALDYLMR